VTVQADVAIGHALEKEQNAMQVQISERCCYLILAPSPNSGGVDLYRHGTSQPDWRP
jgi:hypothetical protein